MIYIDSINKHINFITGSLYMNLDSSAREMTWSFQLGSQTTGG